MFYTKTKLPGGGTAKTEITDESVFTECPDCECEFPVDIAEILSDGEGDLFSTHIFCSRCSVKRLESRGKALDSAKVPLTYDSIVWLTRILDCSGYSEEIQNLYRSFSIDSAKELHPNEYVKFGNALVQMAIGTAKGVRS